MRTSSGKSHPEIDIQPLIDMRRNVCLTDVVVSNVVLDAAEYVRLSGQRGRRWIDKIYKIDMLFDRIDRATPTCKKTPLPKTHMYRHICHAMLADYRHFSCRRSARAQRRVTRHHRSSTTPPAGPSQHHARAASSKTRVADETQYHAVTKFVQCSPACMVEGHATAEH